MSDEAEVKDAADEPVVSTEQANQQTTDTKAEKTLAAAENHKKKEAKTTTGTSKNPFARIWQRYWGKKKFTMPLTILVLIGLVMAIPTIRYPLLGLGLKKNFSAVVIDSSTAQPVSGATVSLDGKQGTTDNQGKVTLSSVPVGHHQLTIIKKYYKDYTVMVLVPIANPSTSFQAQVVATGRQVMVHVADVISGKALANADIRVLDTDAKTDKDGNTSIVLPATNATEKGTISLDGYNDAEITVTITAASSVIKANNFNLTPAGKIYFLSKLSGKIDVVKTNLDGTDRQTVLAGTGNEDDRNTVLLASRDWKYLSLLSTRDDPTKTKLYLINTSNDQLTTMDEGDATFVPVGWSDHHFVYSLTRNGVQQWQSKAQALKTYDADTGQLAIIDETDGQGTGQYDYANTTFGSVYLLKNEIVYAKNWSAYYYSSTLLNGKQDTLLSATPDGKGKRTIQNFPVPPNSTYYYLTLTLYEPQAVIVQAPGSPNTYYKYEDGKIATASDITDEIFTKAYPTYLASPSANQTLWYEQRDGKNTIFVGDQNAANGQQIANLSEYATYGWYTDNYVLVSKNGSELYIMPASGTATTGQILKITDYHKPVITFAGYGGGYGGSN